jgi:hypothetical protein
MWRSVTRVTAGFCPALRCPVGEQTDGRDVVVPQQNGLGTDPESDPIVPVTVTLDERPLMALMVDGAIDQDCRP